MALTQSQLASEVAERSGALAGNDAPRNEHGDGSGQKHGEKETAQEEHGPP